MEHPLSNFTVLITVAVLTRRSIERYTISRRLSQTIRIPFRPFNISTYNQIVIRYFIRTNSILCLLRRHPSIVTSRSSNTITISLHRRLMRTNFRTLISMNTQLIRGGRLQITSSNPSRRNTLRLSTTRLSSNPIFGSLRSRTISRLSNFLTIAIVRATSRQLLKTRSQGSCLRGQSKRKTISQIMLQRVTHHR